MKKLPNNQKQIGWDKVIDGTYNEVDNSSGIPQPKKYIKRKIAHADVKYGNIIGYLSLGATAFVGVFFYIFLSRAYNHIGFMGVYDMLHLLSPSSATPIPDWLNIGVSWLDRVLGTFKFSFQAVLPESWSGFAVVLDYSINYNYIVVTALQIITEFLRMIIQLLGLIYQLGNFVTTCATTGTGIWKGVSVVTQSARDQLWLSLIQ